MTEAGTAVLNCGAVGRLKAPLATTTVRHWRSPPLVRTRYPSSTRLTDVTLVPVRTGACETPANRSMKSTTSGIVMYPSGSGPS